MPRFARRAFWYSHRRRFCAALTLVAYLATAFGVPMPSDARSSSGKTACGCDAADVVAQGSCCCSAPKAPSRPSCCTVPHAAKHSAPDHPKPQPSADRQKVAPSGGVCWVIGMAALKCQGNSTLWVSAGLVLPAMPPVTWGPLLTFAGWLPSSEPIVRASNVVPPDPPPRSFAQVSCCPAIG
jgi:hypothetical protein